MSAPFEKFTVGFNYQKRILVKTYSTKWRDDDLELEECRKFVEDAIHEKIEREAQAMTRCTVCHEPIYRSTPDTTPGRDTPTGWRHVAGDEARGLCHWARAEEENNAEDKGNSR